MKKVSSKKSILILVVAIVIVIMCILIFNTQKNKNTNPSGDNYIEDEYIGDNEDLLFAVNANIELSEKEVIGENIKVTVKLDNDENIYSIMLCPLYNGIPELEEIEATKKDDGVYEAEVNFEALNARDGNYQFKVILKDYNGNEKETISADTVNYSKTGVSYAHAYQKEDGRTAVQITALDKGEVLVSTTNVAPTADDTRWTKYEAGEEYIIATPEESVENVYVWYKAGENIIPVANDGIQVASYEDGVGVLSKEFFRPFSLVNLTGYNYSKDQILSITFKNNLTPPAGAVASHSVSKNYMNDDNSVMGWLVPDANNPSMYNMYVGANGKIIVQSMAPDSGEYITELTFGGFTNCVAMNGLNNLDISNATSLAGAFSYDKALKSIDIKSWDFSNVTDMQEIFGWCESLTDIDLSGLSLPNLDSLFIAFIGCTSLKNADLSEMYMPNLTHMGQIFQDCSALETVNLSNLETKLFNISNIFTNCPNLKNVDMSNFTAAPNLVINSGGRIFSNKPSLISVDLSNFKYLNDTTSMFSGCTNLVEVNLTNANTDNLINMKQMFANCKSLKKLDLSSFNTSKVTDMSQLFLNCESLDSLKLSNFDTSKVIDMSQLFDGCKGLTTLDISSFDTSSCTNMKWMFYNCEKLPSLDVSKFNTSKVTDMTEMFAYDRSLGELDLRSFDTSSIVTNAAMFKNMTNLKLIVLGDKFDIVITNESTADTWINSNTAIITSRATPITFGTNIVFGDDARIYLENKTIEKNYETADINQIVGTDKFRPILELIGPSAITINKGDSYTDQGVTVAGFTSDQSSYYTKYGYKVTLSGSVNTNVAGVYPLTYTITKNDTPLMSEKRNVTVYSPQVDPLFEPSVYTFYILSGNVGSFTYTYNGNGNITAISSATSTCEINSVTNNTITVTGKTPGACLITITASETSDYYAATRTVTVNVLPSYYKNDANVYFATLADAFNETASGGTITVLENVTESIRATNNKTLTLDLNSKTIDASGVTGDWETGREFIQNQGTLTIVDTGKKGSILRSNVNSHVCIVSTTGTLNLKGGTFSLSIGNIRYDPSTIAVDDGTTNIYDGVNIIATRTVIDQWIAGIYAPGGILNMYGGNVEAKGIEGSNTVYGIINRADGTSKINISGGTVRSTGKGIALENHGENIINTQLSVSGNANINGNIYGIYNSAITGGITIDGGTITGKTAGIYQTVANNITTSGTITGEEYGIYNSGNGDISALGGKIEGKSLNGIYILGAGKTTITNTTIAGHTQGIYSENANAIVEINSGSTITSMAESTSAIGMELGTLTVNGGTITGNASGIGATTPNNERSVNITINGGKIEGKTLHGIGCTVNGNIVIGTPQNGVSTSNPEIIGAINGISCTNGFKFYDGILKGKEGAFSGTVTELESGYGVHYDTDSGYKTAYLVAANYKDNASPENTYDTLANAFNKVATGKTIAVIGENVQESTRATLTDNKSIILDLNGKTITYTSEFIGVIDATLEVKDSKDNGEINNTTNYFSGLYYHSNGNIIISGGTIKGLRGISRSDYGAVGASVTMTGGQINATSTCIDVTTEDTVVITDGKLISNTGIGINYAQDESGRLVGSLTIGTKGGTTNTQTPMIQGATYGVISTNGFNFYDGILKGKEGAFNGTVTEVETDYGIHYDIDGDYKTAYLVVANYEDNANPKNTYAKLDDAFNKVASGRTITALKDLTEVGSNRIILEANKDITLNLNNKTITINNITSGAVMWGEIINKGNLTINGKGTITTSTENNNITTLISTENGTLTVDKDVTIEHKGIDFSTYYTLNFIGNYNANIYGKITVNTRETENEKTSGATAINTTGSGTLNIIGATVLAQGTNDSKGYAIRIAGISDIEGTINIKDSNIKSSIGWAIDSYADPESSNKYKVNIENSTIEGTDYGINTDFIGEIEITVKDNAEIRSDNIALVINNNNSVKVLGGLIQGEKIGIENDSGSGAKGKIEIVSGTVKGGSNGITGWGPSTIIIGEPGGNVDITNPIIEGTDYGISTSDKNIEFYDGILKGKTAAYTVKPSKVETGYGVYDGEEGGYKVAYLKKIATIVPTPTKITLIYGDSEDIIYTCNGDGEITANVEDSNISEIILDTSAKKVGVKSHKVGETTVTISMAGTDAYLATSIEVPVTVIQKEIAVIWVPEQDKYEYTYNGQLQGPDVQKEIESAVGEIITFGVRGKEKDAGSYTAEAYIVDVTNGLVENYKLVNATKAFIINRKDLIVKPDANQGKGPGEPEPDLTFTYEGNIEGEIPSFTGSLAREEGENGGRYRIRRGTLELADTDTFKAGNYNLIFIDEDTEFVISYDKEKELILVFKITDTNNKLILPIPASTSNDYVVIWGDNNSDMYTKEGFPEHIYEKAGTYTVEIGGIVKNFGYYNSLRPTESNIYKDYLNYTNQLTGIEQLGDVNAERVGFAFCENLTGDIPEANLDLSDLVSVENMFNNCVLLEGPIPTNLLAGAEKVNSAKNMFLNCENLTGTIPANLFADTTEITTFESTFNNCKNLDGAIPAELFVNGENVTTYAGTFKNCENLDGEIPAELFGKSTRVTTFKETFSNCTGLNTTISPKLFGTNPYVRNYYRTFYNCTGITGTIDENVFGSNVSITELPDKDLNNNFKQTFENCTGITDVRLISLVIGKEMFKGCLSIKTLKLDKTIDIGEKAFEGCNSLTQIEANNDYLRTIGTDAFEYTGTNPEKLLTKINRENELLLNYIWNGDNRLIDVEAPKGTVEIITPKDPYTNNEKVTLKITVEDNYSEPSNCKMVIMNEREYNEFANREYKDYDSLPWQDYAETVAWTLTSNDDLKTVYVLFKDEFGNANVVKDTIN